MAKRDTGSKRKNSGTAPRTPSAANALEQGLVAFAKKVGQVAGTVQAKAQGWMEGDEMKAPKKKPAAAVAPSVVRAVTKGRSGGVVDAPGKKHRKPQPIGPGAARAGSQAAKLRTAAPMAKTDRRRGRG